MNKFNFFLVFSSIFFLFSCNKKKVDSELQTIRFEENALLEFKQVLDTVKHVFLDIETGESIFRDAHKVILFNGKYYILDIVGKNVFVFDSNGGFEAKIGKHGSGPGEYIIPTDFDVDADGNIYIYNGPKKEILVYNNKGLFLKPIALMYEIDNFAIFPNGDFLFTLARYNENKYKNYRAIIVDSILNFRGKYIEYEDSFDSNFILETFLQKGSDVISYYKPIDDKVFVFNKNGIDRTVHLDMGDLSVPLKYRKNIREFKNKHADYYNFVLTTPILLKNYIVGLTVEKNELIVFIYDSVRSKLYKETKNSILPTSYVNDSTFLSVINEVVYPFYESDPKLNIEQKEHIKKGGTILSLVTLK